MFENPMKAGALAPITWINLIKKRLIYVFRQKLDCIRSTVVTTISM